MGWQDYTIAAISNANKPYYTELIRFNDFTTQNGGALDVLAPVTLGVGGTDPDGIITGGAGGVITINKSGPFMIKQSFQVTRNSNPGNAEVFFQAQISVDGGTVWSAIGNSVNRRIANANTINVFFDFAPVFFPAGVKVRNVWAKSSVGGDPANPSSGVNNGQLIYTKPSAALSAAGVADVPSASAVIYTLNGYNYI